MPNRQNITITILGKYSIDHSRSPDSHLKRRNALPSQVFPNDWLSPTNILLDAYGIG